MNTTDHPAPSDATSSASRLSDAGQAIVELLERTPADLREAVAKVADAHAEALASEFYQVMLGDPDAAQFLGHELVSRRLRASMQAWLKQLFEGLSARRVEFLVARELEVGEVHARIRLPIALMQAGTRVLCDGLRRRVLDLGLPTERALLAHVYIGDLMYLAEGIMLGAYIRDVRKGAQALEAYRHVAMSHDIGLERERQRAALSDWANELLFAAHSPNKMGRLPKLAESEFGLWFNHKAQILLDGASDIDIIGDVIQQVDSVLLPKLIYSATLQAPAEPVLDELRRQLEFIRYLLGDLFDRLSSHNSGRDALTGLLSRRHLAAVIESTRNEHQRRGKPFGLAFVHLDELRAELLETDGRNALLQQFAAILLESSRSSDQLFRYDDENFLVVMVEADESAIMGSAQVVRERVFAHRFVLRQNASLRLTTSIGIATFDGHPDYAHLLRRAECAAIAAAAEGGNRVRLG